MDPLTLAVGVGLTTVAGIGTGLRLRRRLRRAEATADRLRRELETERYAAHHDPLTGLLNRRAFYRLGARLLADPARPAVSCVVVDLNAFKQVNDRLGHAAGDDVLITMARRLAGYDAFGTGTVQLVARLGGDEFAGLFVAPATGWAGPCPAADDLADLLAAPMTVGGRQLRVTAAVGAAPVPPDRPDANREQPPDHNQRLTTALQHADSAMYRAKATGMPAAHFDPTLDTDSAPRHPVGLRVTRQVTAPPLAYRPSRPLADAAAPGPRS